jgi:Phosphotransferase enzyme family
MSTPTQLGHDLFGILLYRDDATELLLETTADGLRLPAVAIPRHTRTAEELTAAIKECWDLTTYCLFTLPASTPQYAVLETFHRDAQHPAGMFWTPLDSLPSRAFEDPADLAAVRTSREMMDQYCRGELAGVFGRPGWLRMVREWTGAQAAVAGLRLTGRFRQLNASPTFSLIRFETDGPALWFKAVGEPNVREHRVTLKLASAFPEFLPRILTSSPEWNAWLSLESDGSPLGTDSTRAAWATAAENLEFLQISSIGRRFELIQAGCKDLRPCMLRDLVQPFFDSMMQLMERQTKLSPGPLQQRELLALGREITSALEELEDAGVPNTLGHLDVNPGNVVVSDTRCVFLDWAEAYVGPPFLSFQHLLEHWHQSHKEDLRNDGSPLACYGNHWTRFFPPEQVETSFQLAPLLATFAYAARGLAGRGPERIRPETAGYLRGLVRRMKREADTLRERRLLCVG